jgi:protein-tyrosine-phosphatase
MTVVFVCTGNTCRSPMAEGLMRAELKRRGVSAACVSAGLSAMGEAAADNAVTVMEEVGCDITRHRSRPLTREMIEAADHLVVMTELHRDLLVSAGVPAEKIVLPDGGVPDPFGGSVDVYRFTRDRLQEIVAALCDDWFGEVTA